ncbi:MAG: 2,3-bisphosphoglycerate-dependent phosphoglycerate mutase [Candidatus Roizmanbacteria bacterium GW2011_GWA2_35_19]|uniref:2,3-bisphosphoglycerate-dependent phosphoglycerate mutase n=2 Tax=Candidatus Roizmaniibacteriota TaxID=1752723 RepID=A0A0G0F198_9BACT|nr:MAG: 2,3-bisphosphoglycerate-dependent phosphoglycerate mutase [Candidatus Roizmanbacteria bacterium GW2011_GWC2_35_12]KKP73132.1 MAG: 2,3-bisphosphoglycerate-dependent phosphoglycerate mutase [Candidatus Roizmanbacteria bacterium GW2011_GWA2_35_19]
MKTLVIVRHGLTEWTTRFTGWTDIDLAPEGIEMTKKYALRLKENNYNFDIGFTSYLKRGIRTLETVLDVLGQQNIPIIKDWHLNERHYGTLQTLNKAETVQKYGIDQVNIWRRSYDIPPPKVTLDDPRHPSHDPLYKGVDPSLLPSGESLKDTYERSVPYFKNKVLSEIKDGKKVILSGHHNSLRAIIKYLENISDSEIVKVNVPYCIPLVYEFDDEMKVVKHFYLASNNEVDNVIASIKNQTKS